MTTIVNINGIVYFAPNIGVFITEKFSSVGPEQLYKTVEFAYSYLNEKYLKDACHGGRGPLAEYSELDFEDYLQILDELRVNEATQQAKQEHTKIRRKSFSTKRAQIVLQMIEGGIPYICSYPGCGAVEDLTIDHICPLSRGGTDELSNLQFLCRSHNSQKKDSHPQMRNENAGK